MTSSSGPGAAVSHAHYAMDVHIEFVGPLPDEYNRAAPEATPAQFAAVAAAQDALRAAGYAVVETGHGSLRLGTVDVDPLEIDFQRPSTSERAS